MPPKFVIYIAVFLLSCVFIGLINTYITKKETDDKKLLGPKGNAAVSSVLTSLLWIIAITFLIKKTPPVEGA